MWGTYAMKVILYQPQIPQNAGNVVRTCAAVGCELVMVHPLGFSIQDRWLKRAGLDYWEEVKISFTHDLVAYLEKLSATPFYFFSSKAKTLYTEVHYQKHSQLIFGSETAGLPAELREKWPDRFVTLPMCKTRCLNLATTVGIAIYEAWRQQNFQ